MTTMPISRFWFDLAMLCRQAAHARFILAKVYPEREAEHLRIAKEGLRRGQAYLHDARRFPTPEG